MRAAAAATAPLFLALCCGLAQVATADVFLTKWCDNSFRIRVTAAGEDAPATATVRKALAARLKAENLTDLPGALVATHCGEAAPIKAVDGTTVKNGNLAVELSAGVLKVTAVDSGKTLFTAKTTFSKPLNSTGSGNGEPRDYPAGFQTIDLALMAGEAAERIYGLGALLPMGTI